MGKKLVRLEQLILLSELLLYNLAMTLPGAGRDGPHKRARRGDPHLPEEVVPETNISPRRVFSLAFSSRLVAVTSSRGRGTPRL